MKIAAVIVTCNRLELLPRALSSVKKQSRKPDRVFVISNSKDETFRQEKSICKTFGFQILRNARSENYAGALNTGIEEIIKQYSISDDLYFASLDDDDVWLPTYLQQIEAHNTNNYDLIAANGLRYSADENLLMTLPNELSTSDFLKGNPGFEGSNTFIRLKTLLTAGCFDEALHSLVDRDFLVRVFQQNPQYKIIPKHLVTVYTDENRERLTTNRKKKIQSLQIFYYKYQHWMGSEEKEFFFKRAENYFSIQRGDIEIDQPKVPPVEKRQLEFKNKGHYQFVIGFIAGNEMTARRIAQQIIEEKIPVDLLLMIDNVPMGESLNDIESILETNSIPYLIIKQKDWKRNLKSAHYGTYYKHYSDINSIPLGRTILHHHLFTETKTFAKPVFWIIDDDVTFRSTICSQTKMETADVFSIINDHIHNTEAVIGGISNDPPIPILSCIRSQLVDFLHSVTSGGNSSCDGFSLRDKVDYYYDLSDSHSDHLEVPIYHTATSGEDLQQLLSGKALSRPVLQKELKSVDKTITRRGANTLVFNRELLRHYPVINLEVNNKQARRGDLVWALLHQIGSGRKILEHTFSLEHSRPNSQIDLKKELDKAAYDIIGYAFAKAILRSIETVKREANLNRTAEVYESLTEDRFYSQFWDDYQCYLKRRTARFLMNFYRITGLVKLLSKDFIAARSFHQQISDPTVLDAFYTPLMAAKKQETVISFIQNLKAAIQDYGNSTSGVFKRTCQLFEEKIRQAKQEIQYYQDKICHETYGFTSEQVSGTRTTTEQLLFTTSTGVFIYDAVNEEYLKILDGKYYGLTKHRDYWIAARSNNKGDRSHIENNRISDICAFKISSKFEVQDLRVLLYGLPGEIHQIDISKDQLFIPHTDFNQVLYIDIDDCLSSATPRSIVECHHLELDIYPYSHLNSVFVSNDHLHLIAHNFTMKTGKLSDRIIVNLGSQQVETIPLEAHSAHNICIDKQGYLFCDSNNKTLYKNQVKLFRGDKLLRGLSLTKEEIYVGGSDICFDNFKRFSNNPCIYVLDRDSGDHLKTVNFAGLGDMYEIRQLNKIDYSLSQNN